MSNEQTIQLVVSRCLNKRVLLLTTSNRWEGDREKPKSTILAETCQQQIPGAQLIDCSKLKIWECEGNVSTGKGKDRKSVV